MLLSIVVRSVIVYLFVILAIRFFGKKELSQLSIVDLVFILLISNSLQAAMVGNDVTLAGGLVAAASLFIVNWLLKNLIYKSKKISETIQGSPIMLVYQGKIIHKHLEKAQISHEELEAAIREHGVKDIAAVDLAILEVDGNISVLSSNFTKKTRKRRIHKSLSFSN
ncbi:MAG TPA: YetF domain-containing protein [Patescibacteria group bacterium]